MPERWFRQAVIYCLDVDTYQDSNGDGVASLGKANGLDGEAAFGHPSAGRPGRSEEGGLDDARHQEGNLDDQLNAARRRLVTETSAWTWKK